MHPPISAERWAALRALREREPPTFPKLAAASGIHVTTLRERASRDNWKKLRLAEARARQADALPTPEADEKRIADAREALAGLGEGNSARFLQKQFEALMLEAAATGRMPEKAKIDSLIAMARLAKELKTPAQERADEQKDGDADLGDRLRRIDDRIIELAEAHARWLVGERDR